MLSRTRSSYQISLPSAPRGRFHALSWVGQVVPAGFSRRVCGSAALIVRLPVGRLSLRGWWRRKGGEFCAPALSSFQLRRCTRKNKIRIRSSLCCTVYAVISCAFGPSLCSTSKQRVWRCSQAYSPAEHAAARHRSQGKHGKWRAGMAYVHVHLSLPTLLYPGHGIPDCPHTTPFSAPHPEGLARGPLCAPINPDPRSRLATFASPRGQRAIQRS